MPESLVAVRPTESASIPTTARASAESAERDSFVEHLDEADRAATNPEPPADEGPEPVPTEQTEAIESDAAVPTATEAPPAELPEETSAPVGTATPAAPNATAGSPLEVEVVAPDVPSETPTAPLLVAPISGELAANPSTDVEAKGGDAPAATELVVPEEPGDPLASDGDVDTPDESLADTEGTSDLAPNDSETPFESEAMDLEAPDLPASTAERAAVSTRADPTAPTTAPTVASTAAPRPAPPAPPPPPPAAPTAPPEPTTAFVTERMRTMLREGGGEARLHLRPPELGAVTLSVVVEDGRVRATIQAERVDVADKLRKHGPDLRDALKEEGFTIEDLSIGAGGADGRPGAGPDPRSVAFWMEGLADGTSPDESIESGPASARRIRHVGPGGIDLLA